MKIKLCKRCGKEFEITAPAQLNCSTCGPIVAKETAKRGSWEHRRRNGKMVGVGSGHNQPSGSLDPQYSSGMGWLHKYKKVLKARLNRCERCAKDLTSASKYEWTCHHKDRNRSNNVPENIELLCKRCHQIEHNCIQALQGATTNRPRITNPDQPHGSDGRFVSKSRVQEDSKRAGSDE